MNSQFIEKSMYNIYIMYCLLKRAHALVNLENEVQLFLTLNTHNYFITLICLKHFSNPRKDRYIFLLNVYFVKIKNEHGNVHFNYFFSDFSDNVMRTFYKVAVTMQQIMQYCYMTSIITSLD